MAVNWLIHFLIVILSANQSKSFKECVKIWLKSADKMKYQQKDCCAWEMHLNCWLSSHPMKSNANYYYLEFIFISTSTWMKLANYCRISNEWIQRQLGLSCFWIKVYEAKSAARKRSRNGRLKSNQETRTMLMSSLRSVDWWDIESKFLWINCYENLTIEFLNFSRYEYACVIYGWDPKCTASKDWIYQMRVHNLRFKEEQPFYNVLVEDGSSRYAAQGND